MEANINMNRRGFLGLLGAGAGVTAMAALGGCAPQTPQTAAAQSEPETLAQTGDWLGAAPEIAEDEIVQTIDCDLLIVGAGNAGMVAAATAADLGLDFVVCEAGGAPAGTRMWNGFVNTSLHDAAGIKLDEMKIVNELVRYASGICDPAVLKTWITDSADTFDYIDGIMKAEGYSCYLDTEGYENHATGGTDYVIVPIQHMWYQEEAANGLRALAGMLTPRQRNEVLLDYIGAKGHEVNFQHKLVKLLRAEGGRAEGGIFETSDGYVRVNAKKGTLLACGGYSANVELLEKLAPMGMYTAVNKSEPNNDGNALKAALWIGAEKDPVGAPMVFDRGAIAPGVDAGYETGAFQGATIQPLGSLPFIKVNRDGVRFANESAPYDVFWNQCAQQPGSVWATVFDGDYLAQAQQLNVIGCAKIGVEMLQMGAASGGIENDPIFGQKLFESGLIFKADTLEELADAMGLPKEAFLAQVEEYNRMSDEQRDEVFGKEGYRITPIRKAPFYGYWGGGYLMCTVDGIRINKDMQVLDAQGGVIEGLYAAGNYAGSKFSNNYPGYFVGIASGSAMTEGRHAVRHLAGDIA